MAAIGDRAAQATLFTALLHRIFFPTIVDTLIAANKLNG